MFILVTGVYLACCVNWSVTYKFQRIITWAFYSGPRSPHRATFPKKMGSSGQLHRRFRFVAKRPITNERRSGWPLGSAESVASGNESSVIEKVDIVDRCLIRKLLIGDLFFSEGWKGCVYHFNVPALILVIPISTHCIQRRAPIWGKCIIAWRRIMCIPWFLSLIVVWIGYESTSRDYSNPFSVIRSWCNRVMDTYPSADTILPKQFNMSPMSMLMVAFRYFLVCESSHTLRLTLKKGMSGILGAITKWALVWHTEGSEGQCNSSAIEVQYYIVTWRSGIMI